MQTKLIKSCSSEKQKLPEECVNVFPFRMSLIYSSLSFHVAWQKLSPEKVYHVLVAPCFDKKLEAVREEFYNSLLETRDVDCVLTSGSLFSRPTDTCLQKYSTYRFIITEKMWNIICFSFFNTAAGSKTNMNPGYLTVFCSLSPQLYPYERHLVSPSAVIWESFWPRCLVETEGCTFSQHDF